MSMYPITDEMIIGISNIPELDTSFVENANELGIRCIKDFTGFDEESNKYASHNTYLIVFTNGYCIPFSGPKEYLSDFINNL